MLGKEGTPDVSTGGFDDSARTGRLDPRAIGEKAGKLAVDSKGARSLDRPGTMDVVFTPDAFSELAEHLIAPAFYGDRVSRGESHLADRLGEKVAHENLRIVDDGLLPDGPNTAAVDDEGLPSGRTTLMSRGIVRRFIYDAASACETGGKPTGNGIRMDNWGSDRSFKVTPRTGARNLVLSWEEKASLDGLIAEVKNGVYVHELLGSHTANRISGDFSIGSSLLFRIRKGEVREPLQGVMLAGNMFAAMEEIGGMADDHRNVGGTLSPVAVRTPSVWLRGINVTG
jgi:PmbA protein